MTGSVRIKSKVSTYEAGYDCPCRPRFLNEGDKRIDSAARVIEFPKFLHFNFESVNFNLVGTLMSGIYQQKEEDRETVTDFGLNRSVALILDEVSIRDTSLRLEVPTKEAESLERL